MSQTSVGVEYDKMNMTEVEASFAEYGLGYDGPDVKFRQGYDQILPTLAGDYNVTLSTPVERISYGAGGVRLGLSGDESEACDAVLVTVPLGALKNETIVFDPPFDQERKAAIGRMGMGTLDKVYLLFDQLFWDDDLSPSAPSIFMRVDACYHA